MFVDPAGCAVNPLSVIFFCIFVVPGAIMGFFQNLGFSEDAILRLAESIEYYPFNALNICTDGTNSGYDDPKWHQDGTAFFYKVGKLFEYLNPFQVRYVVLPPGYKGNAKLGDIAVLMDFQKLTFSIGIIGDRGPTANDYSEVSAAMAWDLGYTKAQANGLWGPSGNFAVAYTPGTSGIAIGASTLGGLIKIFRRAGYWLRDYTTL